MRPKIAPKWPFDGVILGVECWGLRFRRVIRGVYVDQGAPDAWTLRAAAVLSAAPPGSLICGASALRLIIEAAGFPCPAVNPTISDAQGRFVARVDLLLEDWSVVLEYDGAVHLEEEVRRRDHRRRRDLEDLGYRMLVATADDVARPWRFLASLQASITAQARVLDRPAPVFQAQRHER